MVPKSPIEQPNKHHKVLILAFFQVCEQFQFNIFKYTEIYNSYKFIYLLKINNKIDLFFEYAEDMNKRFLSIKCSSNKRLNEIN